jgi:hypothetical protein
MRGRNILVLVVAGLLLFTVGAFAERAAIWADSPSAYPHYRETADEAQKRLPILSAQQALKAAKDQQPCANQEGHDASDLCAQWRAADAAQRAARWSWYQLWLSAIGVIGLIVTLWFNLEAWGQSRKAEGDTQKALEAARDNALAAGKLAATAEKQLGHSLQMARPFLASGDDELHIRPGEDEQFLLRLKLRNTGNTAAHNVEFWASNVFQTAAGQSGLLPGHWRHGSLAQRGDLVLEYCFGVTAQQMEALSAKQGEIRIELRGIYINEFGEEWTYTNYVVVSGDSLKTKDVYSRGTTQQRTAPKESPEEGAERLLPLEPRE